MRFVSSVILLCLLIIISMFFISQVSVAGDSGSQDQQIQDDAERLIGAWQRQDGPYLIDIYKILKEGELDAAYYNPKPINVSRALFTKENEGLKVFIELRDINYPGSTYTLTYSSKNDSLAGEYFHAGINRTFDVIFLRRKN